MRIEYADGRAVESPEELVGFFEGWPKAPTPETHLRLLHGGGRALVARDLDAGRVVGFITAITDGVLFAYIPLLEVLPEYRGHGIGAELTRRMLAKLGELYAVDLLCDPELQPFYERLGMVRASGMAVRRYDRQSGGPHDEAGW